MNYYEILGLEKKCSKEDIKCSYRTLAIKYHPDKGGSEETFKKDQKHTIFFQIVKKD